MTRFLRDLSGLGHLMVLFAVYAALHLTIYVNLPDNDPVIHNDDWVYAYPVEQFSKGQGFHLHPMTAALALPQIGMAMLFSAVTGWYSPLWLRHGMVLAGLLAVWACWWFLREAGLSRWKSSLGSMLFMICPLTVAMTWSFQTDIPFVGFSIAALAAVLSAVRTDRWSLLFLSLVFLLVATLTRQTGLFVGVSMGAYLLTQRRWVWAALVAFPIVASMGLERALMASGELPYLEYAQATLRESLQSGIPLRIARSLYEGAHLTALLGVLMLPVLIGAISPLGRSRGWFGMIATLVVFAAMIAMDHSGHRTAATGNYLYAAGIGIDSPHSFGIGPPNVGHLPAGGPNGVSTFSTWPTIFNAVAALSGIALILHFRKQTHAGWHAVRQSQKTPEVLLLLTSASLMGAALLTSAWIARIPFDRYLLPIVPVGIAILLRNATHERWLMTAGLAGCGIFAVWSTIGVVDYWHWNAARFEATRWLESQGKLPVQIDAGYEYNGPRGTLDWRPDSDTGKPVHQPADRMGQPTVAHPEDLLDFYVVSFRTQHHSGTTIASVPYRSPLSIRDPQFIDVIRFRRRVDPPPSQTEVSLNEKNMSVMPAQN